ncbi:peptidase M20 [Defluviimonas sp. 20V17]|uniref:Amidohydrolase n=1 Tax=Allgaiera indica TaxID=765699 RepID=A0AAN4UN42_9RHOB|nr:amidohydrolase [Allgaiera indica]KDB03034.1 peptidase M20 [Defluviimonas sp. 20V17]GHD98679.1 peptidase M20 [Allgaiera indica]SDW08547.1 amidohydrolase [Allgaiera indica]
MRQDIGSTAAQDGARGLSNRDIVELTEFRRALHRRPELSGEERETARAVVAALGPTAPDALLTDLGGHGVAAVYAGGAPGPTVLIRAELDALPIEEVGTLPYRSETPGKGHLCGHDGHATILVGLARLLGRRRPARGRAVLLFQPAEETGEGAAAVLEDPAFGQIAPDWAFALHNMPGLALGRVSLAEGPANCASVGLRIALSGRTAHASMPEDGVSPAAALARLIPVLTALGPGGALVPGFRLATITHARLGAPAFGVAPGAGELWLTLRALLDDDLQDLLTRAKEIAREEARADGLEIAFSEHDLFLACRNDAEAVVRLRAALGAEGIAHDAENLPMRASEDFGRFGAVARSAMFLLGAGRDRPALHNPDYDFPDELIALGTQIFHRTLRDLLG